MKINKKLALLLTIGGVSLSPVYGNLAAQTPASPKPSEQRERTLPYRGTIGMIDIKKGTFTLKNKKNTENRLFHIDQKTRFESGKETKALKNLKPNLKVRGSCIKTGERQFIARLVRWEVEDSAALSEEKTTDQGDQVDKTPKK